MLNVMRSEWYRQRHNRGLAITCLVLLGVMLAVVGVLTYYRTVPGFSYANTRFALAQVSNSMYMVFLLTIVIISMMENTAKLKQSPVKSSIAYGITRTELYMGKFFLLLILCTGLYIVLPACYIGLSYLLLEHSNAGETGYLIRALAGTYPLCIFMLAVCLCIIHNMGNTMQAAVAIAIIVFVIPKTLLFLGLKYPAVELVASWLPTNLFDAGYDENHAVYFIWDSAYGMAKCYIAGITGTILAVAAGLQWFFRREMK